MIDIQTVRMGQKMSTATLSTKFQISVPKDVRDALGLVPGQKLAFINTGTGVSLIPQPKLTSLVGMARGANTAGVRDRDDRQVNLSPKRKALRPSK